MSDLFWLERIANLTGQGLAIMNSNWEATKPNTTLSTKKHLMELFPQINFTSVQFLAQSDLHFYLHGSVPYCAALQYW